MNVRAQLLIPLVLVVAGCASTPPEPLSGEFAAIDPAEAARTDHRGAVVRWGGVLAAVEPLPDRTCFQIVGRELNRKGRPILEDRSSGRFLACRAGFYDPQVFTEGRSITITGTLDGAENRSIGEYQYLHPRVAAEVIYLWPEDSYDASPGRYNVGIGYGRSRFR